jgi:hypothetical protein
VTEILCRPLTACDHHSRKKYKNYRQNTGEFHDWNFFARGAAFRPVDAGPNVMRDNTSVRFSVSFAPLHLNVSVKFPLSWPIFIYDNAYHLIFFKNYILNQNIENLPKQLLDNFCFPTESGRTELSLCASTKG